MPWKTKEAANGYQMRLRASRRRAGLCTRCGKNSAAPAAYEEYMDPKTGRGRLCLGCRQAAVKKRKASHATP